MGGADKGLQDYRGRPLAAHALDYLAGCEPKLISANRNSERYAALGAQVIEDRLGGHQGPLSGIETALSQVTTPWLFVVPCDVIGVPDGWMQHLLAMARHHASPWAGTSIDDGRRVQPLVSIWSRRLLPELHRFLDGGNRRVMDFVDPWVGHVLALPPGSRLRNLNTPESLQL